MPQRVAESGWKAALIASWLMASTMLAALPSAHAASATARCLGHAASLMQAASAIVCDAADRPLLIVGDQHGSNEIPGFVARLVRDASARRPVRLGLELETFEQHAVQVYMASKGAAADRAALLHDNFWTVGQGRTSLAIVALIESVRALREQGRDVDVFTTVPDFPGEVAIKQAAGPNAYRSEKMAEAIHDQVQHGAAHQLVIAFMGTAHSTYSEAGPASDNSVTERLLADKPYLVNPLFHGGLAWNCTANACGPHQVPDASGAAASASLQHKVRKQSAEATQVSLQFPPLTASPPAKEKPPTH